MAPLQRNDEPERAVSESVIDAVADAQDVPAPSVSPPLYEAIDPDALDALFRPSTTPSAPDRVEFTYAGYTVVVRDGGEIHLRNDPGTGSR